jgi:hypothetical protein
VSPMYAKIRHGFTKQVKAIWDLNGTVKDDTFLYGRVIYLDENINYSICSIYLYWEISFIGSSTLGDSANSSLNIVNF